jgi:hypothetical protein
VRELGKTEKRRTNDLGDLRKNVGKRPTKTFQSRKKKETNKRTKERRKRCREREERERKVKEEEEIRRWMENVLAGGVWCIPPLLLLHFSPLRDLLPQSRPPPENIPTSSSSTSPFPCPIRGNA